MSSRGYRGADVARSVPRDEGDRIAAMVLALVEHLADGMGSPHHRDPTGVTVTDEMRPYVELAASKRSPSGRVLPRRDDRAA